jgi:hypothetical protein
LKLDPSTLRRVLLGVVTSAVAVGVLSVCYRAARSPADGLSGAALDAEVRRAAPSESACPLVRDAPKAEAPLRDAAAACAVLDLVRASFQKGSAITDPELQQLRADVARAVTESPSACVDVLSAELAQATDCGLVYDAVAIRVVNGAGVSPKRVAFELRRPAACQWKLLSALREAERASPTVVAALIDLTASVDSDVSKAAWMTLGSVGRIARAASQEELVSCMDHAISAELSSVEGEMLPVLIASAGNAACEACRSRLSALQTSADAVLRRTALVALRFMTTDADVDMLCRALKSDTEASVRAAVAYALQFSTNAMGPRVQCLFDAAIGDASEAVSNDAVASLEELADRSELAIGVLVHVAKQADRPKVKMRAATALRRFASEKDVRDVLEGR